MPLPRELADRFQQLTGLRIVDVAQDSPAQRAGLRAGDLLLTADGQRVENAQAISRLMFAETIRRRLPLTVLRNGALVDVIAEPVELTSRRRG